MLHIRSMWQWPHLLSTIWDCRDGVENSVHTNLHQPLVWPNPSHTKLKCGCKLFSVTCLQQDVLQLVKFGTLPIVGNHFFICLEPSVSLAGDMLSLHLNELNNSAIVILSATTYWDELSIASESSFFLWIISFLLYWAQNITFYVTCLQGSCWILSYWPILCALALQPTLLNSVHVYRKERWMIYMW